MTRFWVGYVVFGVLLSLFGGGCSETAMTQQPLQHPPILTAEEHIEVPEQNLNFPPFRANGDGYVEFIDQNGVRKKEGLTKVDIFLTSDDKMYVNFDHLLQSKAMRMGTTGEEFWCWVRFSEINDYYWGQQDLIDRACLMPYGLRPEIICESLGFIDYQSQIEDSTLTREEGYTVFSVVNHDGHTIKRYYFNPRTSLVHRIEYLGGFDTPFLVAKMSNFRRFTGYGNYSFPTTVYLEAQDSSMTVKINLKNIRSLDLPASKQQRLFSRPAPKGAKKMYQMNEYCEFELR